MVSGVRERTTTDDGDGAVHDDDVADRQSQAKPTDPKRTAGVIGSSAGERVRTTAAVSGGGPVWHLSVAGVVLRASGESGSTTATAPFTLATTTTTALQ